MNPLQNVTREQIDRFFEEVEEGYTTAFSADDLDRIEWLTALNINNTSVYYFGALDLIDRYSPEQSAHIFAEMYNAPEDLQRFGGWYFPALVEALKDLRG